jgi:mRNA-degrading endonuclease RelE of RelBE toxin-antitoxin system
MASGSAASGWLGGDWASEHRTRRSRAEREPNIDDLADLEDRAALAAHLTDSARTRSEDKDLFTRTRRAVASLGEQPYPEDAVAWGGTGVYRLHAGDIRVLYEVDDDAATVYITNIGIIS